jgi:hypothetical protein
MTAYARLFASDLQDAHRRYSPMDALAPALKLWHSDSFRLFCAPCCLWLALGDGRFAYQPPQAPMQVF